jgi:hypothetical protein
MARRNALGEAAWSIVPGQARIADYVGKITNGKTA